MLDQVLCDTCVREIAAAEAALRASSRSPHRCVHRARKALRRARALLALGGRADEAFAEVDAKLRRATRALSRLRDAAVAVETFDRIVKGNVLHAEAAGVRPLRERLVRQRDAVLAAERERDPGFAKLRARLEASRAAVRALAWAQAGSRKVARELAHSLRRIAKVEDAARRSNAEHVRHRWRRRLRRYNDQRTLLSDLLAAAPPGAAADAGQLFPRRASNDEADGARLDAAAHALGLEHDLRLLRRLVRGTDAIDDEPRRRLLAALNRRLRKLRKRDGI